ncbi:MAG TPA: hypothetical protein ENJ57_08515 [Rhizobiales bacterium]|nr:hypothetical protein [Hyphomicrobiales bacterium]
MVIFRSLSYLLLSLAFVITLLDAIRSLAANALVITPLGQLWTSLHVSSLHLVQSFLVDRDLNLLWDPVMLTILKWPAFTVPAIAALLLAWIGRKRPQNRKWISEVE